MHLSVRYGSKGMVPINHIEESIAEGRISTRGLANQGWLHKQINNYTITNCDRKVITVDLRASNDQIIALGILDPNTLEVEDGFWSNDSAYKRYWKVEWLRVFPKPLTQKEFEEEFSIKEGLLKNQFHHAQHSWKSEDLDLSHVRKQSFDSWLHSSLETIEQNVLDSERYIMNHLSQAFSIEDHERLINIFKEAVSICNKAKDRGYTEEAQTQWRESIKVKPEKKRKGKKRKLSKKQKVEKSFAKKFKKIIDEAKESGITKDLELASYFSKRKYTKLNGKRKWHWQTIKSYRKKYLTA